MATREQIEQFANLGTNLVALAKQAEQTYAEVKAHEATKSRYELLDENYKAMRAERDSHSRKLADLVKTLTEIEIAATADGWNAGTSTLTAWLKRRTANCNQRHEDETDRHRREMDESALVLGEVRAQRDTSRRESEGRLKLLQEIRAAATKAGCAPGQTVSTWINNFDASYSNMSASVEQLRSRIDELTATQTVSQTLREYEAYASVYGVAASMRTFPVPSQDHDRLIAVVDLARELIEKDA
jgi:hypothetical protein